MSTVTFGQISDGTSCTYLFGEKYICPDAYLSGESHGDCFDAYGGAGPDVLRYGANHSRWGNVFGFICRDTPGYLPEAIWGSPHVSGLNMVFCDGSVHTIGFNISDIVSDQLSNRADGQTIAPDYF